MGIFTLLTIKNYCHVDNPFCKSSLMKGKINKQINKNLFNEIDIKLLFGIRCSGNNKFQQNYLEKIRFQTESAFMNKKFNNFKN